MKAKHFRLRRRGALFRSGEAPLGYLEFAGWMARGVLWLDGWLTGNSQEPVEVAIEAGGRELSSVQAERFSYPRSDLAAIPGATGQVLALPLGPEANGNRIDALYLRQGDDWYRWTSRRGKPIQPDLVARLRHKLSLLPEIRPDLGSFLARRCARALSLDAASDSLYQSHVATFDVSMPATEEAAGGDQGVADGERAAPDSESSPSSRPDSEVEADEEPLPSFVADPTKPLGLCIDAVVAPGGESFFVKGWIWDLHGLVEELELVSSDGRRRQLLGSMIRAERPDVNDLFRPEFEDRVEGRHGFFGFFETGVPRRDPRHYSFELRVSDGESLAAGMPPLITDPFAARDAVFAALPDMYARDLEHFPDRIHPANELIRSRNRERVGVRRTFGFGEAPSDPAISLVIPVSERIELVEHQLAQFADDPKLGECEVIFVLDAPRNAAWLEDVVFHLSRLYRIPIRGVVLSHRGGHAAATNIGAAHARGRLLLLMHASVFPDRPGWLGGLAEFHDSKPEIGALAPKLLYEDESVRHAGLYFAKGLEPDDLWSCTRFHQGLPRRYQAVEVARQVPAVTGACLMIRRDLFDRLGGLRDIYFDTDFEDADLCLRCAGDGLENWYLPSVELFHLEGMATKFETDWRRNPWSRLYDRWLQGRRWDDQIKASMALSR